MLPWFFDFIVNESKAKFIDPASLATEASILLTTEAGVVLRKE